MMMMTGFESKILYSKEISVLNGFCLLWLFEYGYLYCVMLPLYL